MLTAKPSVIPPRTPPHYAAEFAGARLGSRFAPALEDEYLQHQTECSLPLLRLGSLVTLLLYLVGLSLDWRFHGRLGLGWHYVALFLVMAPLSMAPGLATYRPRWRRHAGALATAATTLNAAVLLVLIVLMTRRQIDFPHAVLSLPLMYFFLLSGLLFRIALPMAAATVLVYGLVAHAAGMPLPQQIDALFVLGGLLLLGGIACGLLERADRLNWLHARLVEELSQRDDLTGLHNRRYFYEQGERLLANAQRERKRLALLLIDVDYFKQYNDARGHLTGDDCLRRVGQALQQLARRPLDVLARLGGDEFAILAYDQRPDSLAVYAELLRAAVAQLNPGGSGAGEGAVTVSIGAALSQPQEHADLERLVGMADGALYRSKALGRDRISIVADE